MSTFTDDFDRASLGGDYVSDGLYTLPPITTNSIRPVSNNVDYGALLNLAFDDDQSLQFDVNFGSTSNYYAAWLDLRRTGLDFYELFLESDGGTRTAYLIYIVDADYDNGVTLLDSYSFASGAHTWKIAVTGTGLSVLFDGGEVMSATDSNLTGGEVTFGVFRSGGSSGNLILDNLVATGVAASATAPAAVDDLAATPGNGQVSLSWSAPDDGGSAITDYEYRVDGGTWTSTGSSSPGHTVTGLTNGVEYDFEVRAVNSVGSAAASNLVSSTPTTTPGTPTSLQVIAGDGKCGLHWVAPASDGGSAITGYKVERNVDSGGWTNASADTGTARPWFFDTGVSNSDSVEYRVSAITAVGTGSATAASSAVVPAEKLFPVGATSRYLQDQNGDPFLMVGDTVWSIFAQGTPAQMVTYLNDRASKNVNAILVSLVEHYYADNAPGNNIEDEYPWTGTAFQSTLNETYWEIVDFGIEWAECAGITVIACPAYLGYPSTEEGWDTEVVAATNTQMATYGGYLDSRYSARSNVVWLHGHDRIPSSTEKARMENLDGALPSGHLRTLGGSRVTTSGAASGIQDWGSTSISPDFDTIYTNDTDAITYCRTDGWAGSVPFIFLEGGYEGDGITDVNLRSQFWGAWAIGATGAVFGSQNIWTFGWTTAPDPLTHLDDDGALWLEEFATLGPTTDWAPTLADTGSTFLTSGRNAGTSSEAGVRFDGDSGLIYYPTSRSLTLDLTEFATNWDSVDITRYDPTSGASTSITSDESTANTGYVVGTQGNNAAGNPDWLIVVTGNTEAAAGPTMPLGDVVVDAVHLGDVAVDAIYLGDNQVF